jgi:phytanoyl-CoA hydroxylase
MMLNDEQMKSWQEDGYLVVSDLLTSDEVDAFLKAQESEVPEEARGLGLKRYRADGSWASMAKHAKISGIVSDLMGGDPRIVQTMYMAKSPEGGTGVALHQDTHYIRNEPNTLMACWIALSDTDGENGGLCVVPGSHKRPLYETAPPEDDSEHAAWEKDYEMKGPDGKEWVESMHSHQIVGLDHDEIAYLTVPRGSGVFFTSMTIHGSFANRSGTRPRLAFATHYVKDGTWVYRADIHETDPVLGAGG